MKILILFIISYKLLFALDIDSKMFDDNEAISYLKEIEKKIANERNNNQKPLKTTNEESYYLSKLNSALTKKIEIERVDFKLKRSEQISLSNIVNIIKLQLDIFEQIENQENLLNEIQNKLSFSKKQIENFTKDDKNNSLLYQLQFAYFKVHKNNIEAKKRLFFEYKDELDNYLLELIVSIKDIDIKKLDKELKLSEDKIEEILQNQAEVQIEMEKAKIDENQNEYNKQLKNLESIKKLYFETNLKVIDIFLKEIIYSFNTKNEKLYIKYFNFLKEKVFLIDNKKYDILTSIINDLAKNIFGNTKVIIASSSLEFKTIYENIKEKLTGTLFIFNEQAITFFSLLKALFIVIVGFILGIIYKKWLLNISSKWSNISDMSLKISSNIGYYLIIFISFMVAISSLGIDLTSLSLIAGALSIGIGFGLQTVVSNLIAGIILMFERTIRIGDVIEINELLKGTVSDIRIRSTTIKTFDNIDIVIPNSSFIQNNVINWTLEDPTRRLHIPFGVAYGTKIEKVKEAVLSELNNSDLTFIRAISSKQPEIRMEMMNASSVDLELLVWVKTNDKIKPNALKSDFLILIYNALYKHDIEIPFPQMDVHIDKKFIK